MSPILGIWASQNYARYSITGSYDSIATVTVGAGGVADVEFTSIPSTYTHLQIRLMARTTASVTESSTNIWINGVTTGNKYATHVLQGNGSTAAAYAGTSLNAMDSASIPGANATASVFGVQVIDILDYANTNKTKVIRMLKGFDRNGGGNIDLWSGLFNDTSAITSIKFGANNWAQYSHFALYGVKGI